MFAFLASGGDLTLIQQLRWFVYQHPSTLFVIGTLCGFYLCWLCYKFRWLKQ